MRSRMVLVFITGAIISLVITVSLATEVTLEDGMTGIQINQSDVAAEILKIEHEVMEAIKSKDVNALRQFLSDDFIHRAPRTSRL